MNIKQMKSMISKFRSADVSVIKDADMRAKAQKLQNKQGGFTLLELLVVVAILAIIAGAVISSLDGQEELAAQKVTVHTMAALEEGFRVYKASSKRTLPAGMDSLICGDAIASGATAPPASGALIGGTSNVARVGGGLTADLADNLQVLEVGGELRDNIVDAGVTTLRYVEPVVCNATEDSPSFLNGNDEALVNIVKPNLIFQTPLGEDLNSANEEWEYGAGQEVDLTSQAGNFVVAFLQEAGEITGNEGDIVAVFGIGPGSDIVGDIVARAPADGNGGPDKYTNYSVAVKVAECDDEELGEGNCTITGGAIGSGVELVTPKVVAILDAGGDAYDDEVAEARGNQEE